MVNINPSQQASFHFEQSSLYVDALISAYVNLRAPALAEKREQLFKQRADLESSPLHQQWLVANRQSDRVKNKLLTKIDGKNGDKTITNNEIINWVKSTQNIFSKLRNPYNYQNAWTDSYEQTLAKLDVTPKK